MEIYEGHGGRGEVGNKGLKEQSGGDSPIHLRSKTIFDGSVHRK